MDSYPISIYKNRELVYPATSIRDAANYLNVRHSSVQKALKRTPHAIKGFLLKKEPVNEYSQQKSVPTEFIEKNNTGTVSGQARTLDE